MPWECFWIEPVQPFVEFFVICANGHRVVVETMPGVKLDEAPREPGDGWPDACSVCLRNMNYDDANVTASRMGGQVWCRPDTGEEHYRQHEFGPGAMYDASDWVPKQWVNEQDGLSLTVVLPPGEMVDFWHIDGPSSTNGFWQRTGEPPKVTANPSILTPRYHGFLRDGVLTDSLPDRPLP
jgi:hypothetical protein